jgi:hypothetical protein
VPRPWMKTPRVGSGEPALSICRLRVTFGDGVVGGDERSMLSVLEVLY